MKLERQAWESDFFGREIALLAFDEGENLSANLDFSPFALVQAKVENQHFSQADWLQQHGFCLVESEVTFCLDLANFPEKSTTCEIATLADLSELQTLFGQAFSVSRFRPPYFSPTENQRFYQHWITQAVNGKFDDICLIQRHTSGQIQGGISVRLQGDKARLGLLAVSPIFQRQGVASKLLQAGVNWLKARHVQQLWICTQASNQPALSFYQHSGARLISQADWFYLAVKNKNEKQK